MLGYKLSKAYNIRRLNAAPMCMEYMINSFDFNKSYLLWGDAQGTSISSFKYCKHGGLFVGGLYMICCKNLSWHETMRTVLALSEVLVLVTVWLLPW